MTEIERKFLVTSNDFKKESFEQKKIVQGYLNTDPERTVRVRIKGDKAFITVKGKSNEAGFSRFEWEKEIPVKEAEALLQLCELGKVEKIRFLVKAGDHTFEVDEFYGDNEGLVVAEVELSSEKESFLEPDWLGEEVSAEHKYSNSSLTQNPFKKWINQEE